MRVHCTHTVIHIACGVHAMRSKCDIMCANVYEWVRYFCACSRLFVSVHHFLHLKRSTFWFSSLANEQSTNQCVVGPCMYYHCRPNGRNTHFISIYYITLHTMPHIHIVYAYAYILVIVCDHLSTHPKWNIDINLAVSAARCTTLCVRRIYNHRIHSQFVSCVYQAILCGSVWLCATIVGHAYYIAASMHCHEAGMSNGVGGRLVRFGYISSAWLCGCFVRAQLSVHYVGA